jgi:hypothetical protein
VHLVHVVHPHQRPDSLVALFVSFPLKGDRVRPAAAASLRALTKMRASLCDPTAANLGGVPQSRNFCHYHFSNHASLLAMSDTFDIGVNP